MANSRKLCWFVPRAPIEAPIGSLAYCLLISLLGAVTGSAAAEPKAADEKPAWEGALCPPASEGFLRMRLQGAIDAELEWNDDTPKCLGGPRPGGDGVRLLYKGKTDSGDPILVVIGAGPLAAGQSARHVGANMTIVPEGSGQFFSTRSDEKCAFDEITQESVPPHAHRFRLQGRGYCTQPARAVGGDDSVFVSRFDLLALVDYQPPEPETTAEVSSE